MKGKRRISRRRRVLTFLAVLFAGYLLLCLGLAKLYVSPYRIPPPPLRSFTKTMLPDGEPVWASPRLLAGKPAGHTLYVMAHGYGGGIGHWSHVGKQLCEKGNEVVLTEFPAHGDSPDSISGFGPHEAQIVEAATRWARSRYPKPPRVVLVGVSMGGSACWLATAAHPELYDAVVTEGAFARLDETVDRWFGSRISGGAYVFRPVKWFAARMAGVDPLRVNPVEAAEKWKWKGKPALVVHCEDDTLMPRSNADRLAAASGAELWVIPKAEHAQGVSVAEKEYLDRLLDIGQPGEKLKSGPITTSMKS